MYLSLTREDCALKAVHARVPAEFVVVVAAAHSVIAQHAGALGQFVGVGRDHPRVSGGAQVLGGIKAEGRGIAQSACFYAIPLRAPGLGGVFNELDAVAFAEMPEGRPVGTLAVEVNGQDGFDIRSLWRVEDGFYLRRIEVEGGGFNVGQERLCSGAEDGADRGEEAEGRSDDRLTGINTRGGESEPERVRAGGAADGVGHVEPLGGGALEGRHRLAEDELLRFQHVAENFKKFILERMILAF